MDKSIVLKGKMTNIKKYLIELGAVFVKKSDKSMSTYLKFHSDKIRVSDHISTISPNEGLNIIIPFNDLSSTIVSINGVTTICKTMGELKSFLKTWFCIVESMLYSKESIINTNILKKQYELNCLHENVVKEKNNLSNISRNIDTQKKALEKLEKINSFNLVGLTEKQVNQITTLINTYKTSNNKNKSIKKL